MEKKNEELIKLLHQKLDSYTYDTKGEEFDVEEIKKICALLDTLEPMGKKYSAQNSYEKFREKYIEKNKKNIKKKRYSYPKIAMGAAVVCILMFANVGSNATKEKSFFDLLKKDNNEIEMITAGVAEEELVPLSKETYENWEELQKQLGQEVLEAKGLPKELKAAEFTVLPFQDSTTVYAEYFNQDRTKHFKLKIDLYDSEVMKTKILLGEPKLREGGEIETISISGKEVTVVSREEKTYMYFIDGNGFYFFSGNLEEMEIRNIVEETLKK